MLYKKLLRVVAISGMVLFGVSSFADGFKLGYVDVSKIFTTSKPAIALQQALKQKLKPQQDELAKLKNTLLVEQGKVQEIQKKNPDINKLSASDKTIVQQYQKDQYAFQQKYMAYNQLVQRYQDYASALLLGQANGILKNISDKGDYDLVLTSNQLVYAKAKYDLTDQVIAQLKSVNADDLVKQLDKATAEDANPANLQKLSAPK